MKPKNYDICPVCSKQSTEAVTEIDDHLAWVRCDVCRQWYHALCVSLTIGALNQIASYHCPGCEKTHGASHMKRQSKRTKTKIDYVALDQGEVFAVDKSVHPHLSNFLEFEPEAQRSGAGSKYIDILQSKLLTEDFVLRTRLVRPALVPNVSVESGLRLPTSREDITVKYIAQKAGLDEQVEVMDVLSQQSEMPAWNLRRWRDYFYTSESERDRIRNVISLEVSQVEGLGKAFERPTMVRNMDLVDKVWVDSDGERPEVTVYCLMSVRGSYTDFHIDFSGTPVYYTVCHGAKTFLMYPPTTENLELYESWCLEPNQNFIWFADYTKRIGGSRVKPTGGFKVTLEPGDLFIIPSGWIHSVHTPEDAVIIGGNYLTLQDLPMHLKIYEIERKTRVPTRYRFPMFNKVLWLTSWYYYNRRDEYLEDLGIQPKTELDSQHELNQHNANYQCVKSEPNEVAAPPASKSTLSQSAEYGAQLEWSKPGLTAHSAGSGFASLVLRSLIAHLKSHHELSKTQPLAKKSIPYRLVGRNIENYFSKLQDWLEDLESHTAN